MFGSLTRSDYNSVYSLMSYVYLTSYKTKQSLSKTLLILLLITLFVIAFDVWAIILQKEAKESKITGIVLIVIEIIMKLFLMVMLLAWKFRGEKTS
jgi:hypothetical protein